MKKLVIAEKPSVARDLARVLGKIPKKDDFFENDEWIIDSAVGHLVELYMPDDFDPKLKSWKISNLPIIPPAFELKPIASNKKKFQQLKKQLKRKDVELVINACDAGREGELIFTYIYELSKSKLPAKRLWMLSMTDNSIKEAFTNLREGKQLKPLQDAARCRSESDWLIGINGTRAVTIKRTASRGRQVSTVGRVQTPTLSLVIEREKEIKDFRPKTFHKINADFSLSTGNYTGYFHKEGFSKNPSDKHDRVDRLWDQDEANSILAELKSHEFAEVSEVKKRSPQSSGKLYDLTTLQREANRLHHLPASRTLQIAQSLYERHKAITYPRTDSKALPEDYGDTCREILPILPREFKSFTDKIISENWVDQSNKKIFDNAKISDHFAIIPTNNVPKSLDDYERRIYNLIVKRFLAVFHPPAQWDVTTRISKVGDHSFKTEGKVLVEASWLAIYGKDKITADTLVPLTEEDNHRGKLADCFVETDETKPPPRYSEATLLSAMEGAGKLVDDEELAEALKEKGLGTPATRASTIEHLIKEKYLRRESTQIHPTIKAEDLFDFLKAADVDVLTSPSMTGEWEYKLRKIEDGSMTREEFMKEISKLTEEFVSKTTGFQETADNLKETELQSPINGLPLYEGLSFFQDISGDFKISKSIAGRRLEEHEVHSLLKEKRIGPLDDFVAKTGRKFSAMLKLEDDFKVSFVFDKPDQEDSNEKELLNDAPEVANCPVCASVIKQTELSYICEKNKKVSDGECNFRITRKLLDKEIPLEELQKLVSERKTGLIKGFVSRRTKRPFDANLILKDNGGIGFEFPPRPPRKKKTA
jgi:DNA topoisomerase-3